MPGSTGSILTTGALVALLVGCTLGHNIEHLPDWLVLISMDGFRHDYIDLAERAGLNVATFRRIQKEGVKSTTVIDDFVSKTFPNHYTIATGLHEESHGVLGNQFYDPDLKRVFSPLTAADTAMWSNGSTNGSGPEPLWITVQRNKLRSAVINWPSSAAKIKSAYPTYSVGLYGGNKVAMQADYYIDRIIDWFESDEHCRLAMLYLPEPDASGHIYGPASMEVLNAVQLLNGYLGRLLDRLASSQRLNGSVNLVVTSDHGMTNLNASMAIFMDEIVSRQLFDVHSSYDYTAWHLWPKEGQVEAVYQKLLEASRSQPFRVLRPGDPSLIRSRYNYNRRIAPINVLANLHAAIVWNQSCPEYIQLTSGKRRGDHGYNNSESEMHPIFMAWGPAFVAGGTLARVRLVDIYPLCCRLLDLQPAPNNGSVGPELRGVMLLDDDDDAGEKAFFLSTTLVTSFLSFILVACFTSVFALGALRAYRTSLYRKNRRFGLLDPSAANHDSLPLSLDDDEM